MKKTILSALFPLVMATSAAFGTVTLAFDDLSGTANAGTYNPTTTFSFNVNLTFTNPPISSSPGLSYWFEVPTALAPFISITNEQYFVFTVGTHPTDPLDSTTFKVFTTSSGADVGFMADTQADNSVSGDLGATKTGAQIPPQTNTKIATITFSLTGAPAGTYTLKTTSLSPRTSEVTGPTSNDNALDAQAFYTITVVPEPATLTLLGLGGLGSLGLTILRARRKG